MHLLSELLFSDAEVESISNRALDTPPLILFASKPAQETSTDFAASRFDGTHQVLVLSGLLATSQKFIRSSRCCNVQSATLFRNEWHMSTCRECLGKAWHWLMSLAQGPCHWPTGPGMHLASKRMIQASPHVHAQAQWAIFTKPHVAYHMVFSTHIKC